jgi:hypothetical protein
MRKIRYILLAVVLTLLGWYLAAAVPASASRPPADSGGNPVVSGVTAPAQPATVHEQTASWWFVLVAAVAIVATLAVVVGIARFRRSSATLA